MPSAGPWRTRGGRARHGVASGRHADKPERVVGRLLQRCGQRFGVCRHHEPGGRRERDGGRHQASPAATPAGGAGPGNAWRWNCRRSRGRRLGDRCPGHARPGDGRATGARHCRDTRPGRDRVAVRPEHRERCGLPGQLIGCRAGGQHPEQRIKPGLAGRNVAEQVTGNGARGARKVVGVVAGEVSTHSVHLPPRPIRRRCPRPAPGPADRRRVPAARGARPPGPPRRTCRGCWPPRACPVPR